MHIDDELHKWLIINFYVYIIIIKHQICKHTVGIGSFIWNIVKPMNRNSLIFSLKVIRHHDFLIIDVSIELVEFLKGIFTCKWNEMKWNEMILAINILYNNNKSNILRTHCRILVTSVIKETNSSKIFSLAWDIFFSYKEYFFFIFTLK